MFFVSGGKKIPALMLYAALPDHVRGMYAARATRLFDKRKGAEAVILNVFFASAYYTDSPMNEATPIQSSIAAAARYGSMGSNSENASRHIPPTITAFSQCKSP